MQELDSQPRCCEDREHIRRFVPSPVEAEKRPPLPPSGRFEPGERVKEGMA